jgi:hypothetical protein
MENKLSPNRLDSQVHAHRSRYVRAIEHFVTSLRASPNTSAQGGQRTG